MAAISFGDRCDCTAWGKRTTAPFGLANVVRVLIDLEPSGRGILVFQKDNQSQQGECLLPASQRPWHRPPGMHGKVRRVTKDVGPTKKRYNPGTVLGPRNATHLVLFVGSS